MLGLAAGGGTALALTLAATLLPSGALAQAEGTGCAPAQWRVEAGILVNAEQRWIEGGYIRYAGGLCVQTPAGLFTGAQARHAPGDRTLEVDEAGLAALPAGTRLAAGVVTLHLASGEVTLTRLTLTLGASRVEAARGRLTPPGRLEIPGAYRGESPDWGWTGAGLDIDLNSARHQGEAITLEGGPEGERITIHAASHTGAFTGPELDLQGLRLEVGQLTLISTGGAIRGGGFSARGVSLTSCICEESPALLFLAESLEVVPGVQRIVLREAEIRAFGVTVARPGAFLGIDLSAIAAFLPEPTLLIEEAGVTVIVRDLLLASDEQGSVRADLGATGFLGAGVRPELILKASGRMGESSYDLRGGLSRPGAVLDARLAQPLGAGPLQVGSFALAGNPGPARNPTLRLGGFLNGAYPLAEGLAVRPDLRVEIAAEGRTNDALAGASLGISYQTSAENLTFTFDGETGGRVYATAPPFAWAGGRASLEAAAGAVAFSVGYALRRTTGASPFGFDNRPPLQEAGLGLTVTGEDASAGFTLVYDLDARAFSRLTLAAGARITPWEALTIHPRLAFDLPTNTFTRYGLGLTIRTCCFEFRADAGHDSGKATFSLAIGLRR